MIQSIAGRAAVAGALVLLRAGFPDPGALAQTPDYEAIVAAPDRTPGDRQADARRQARQIARLHRVPCRHEGLDMEASAGSAPNCGRVAVGAVRNSLRQASADGIERFVKDKFDIRAKSRS